MLYKTDALTTVRAADLGVLIRVWDWDDETMAVHDHILELVATQVYDGFRQGLTVDEMEEDVLQAFPVFESVDIEIKEHDRMNIILVPLEA